MTKKDDPIKAVKEAEEKRREILRKAKEEAKNRVENLGRDEIISKRLSKEKERGEKRINESQEQAVEDAKQIAEEAEKELKVVKKQGEQMISKAKELILNKIIG